MKSCSTQGAIGDIIYSIPLMRKLNINVIYIIYDDVAPFYSKQEKYYSVLPFLKYLGFIPYLIHRLDVPYDKIDYNFSIQEDYTHSMHLIDLLNRQYNYTFNKADRWLFNIDKVDNSFDVIINRTDRYQSKYVNIVDVINLLSNDITIGFLGFEHELDTLKSQGVNKQNINVVQTTSIVDVAKHINSAKLFIGNGSSSFALAEAMKTTPIIHEQYDVQNLKTYYAQGVTLGVNFLQQLKEFIDKNNLQNLFKEFNSWN